MNNRQQNETTAPTKLPGSKAAGAMALLLGLLLAGPAAATEKARNIAATVCVTCHGADGNSTIPTFPKLAGQQADYIVRQLNAFVTGRRPSDAMVPVVTALDPDDFKALGVHFAAQKPTSETVLDKQAAEKGRKLYFEGDEERGIPACSGCHMEDARGNKRFPRLAGQHREYLVAELMNFRTEARSKGIGRVMREVAVLLKEDEIHAVAEFLAGL